MAPVTLHQSFLSSLCKDDKKTWTNFLVPTGNWASISGKRKEGPPRNLKIDHRMLTPEEFQAGLCDQYPP